MLAVLREMVFTLKAVVLSAFFGIGAELVEWGLTDKAYLVAHPYEILAIAEILFIAAFGILYTAKTVTPGPARVPQAVARSWPWFVILLVVAVFSIAVAGVFLADPKSVAYVVFRVVLPDIAGFVILVVAILATQVSRRAVAQGTCYPSVW